MILSQLLVIQGILWNFYGTIALLFEVIIDLLGINKDFIFPTYSSKNKFHREEKIEVGYREVSLTKKEKRLILWFMLILLGVISQIVSYLI